MHKFCLFTHMFLTMKTIITQRNKRVMNTIIRSRRAMLKRVHRLCLAQNRNSYLMCRQIAPIPPVIIFESIKYRRRMWSKVRSQDFWDRIVLHNFDESQWYESFRMSENSFNVLCEMLQDVLRPKPLFLKSRESVSVRKQVAVALYKLASTAEYRVVGNVFGIHKSTVKNCLYRVVRAMNRIIVPMYIRMPDQNEILQITSHFETISNIPHIMGCIDGTHIPILPPVDGYRDFVNRKGWPSYNVQAVVDHIGRNIVVKHPGSVHDAAVFRSSTLFRNAADIIPQMTKEVNGFQMPVVIVGDPAYPLLPWLLKGYSGRLTPQQESFNVYLNSARVTVEMAFGRLKARWRILQKRIDSDFRFVPEIITACCMLHNFVEARRERFVDEWIQERENNDNMFPQPAVYINQRRGEVMATIMRDHLSTYLAANFPLRRALILTH